MTIQLCIYIKISKKLLDKFSKVSLFGTIGGFVPIEIVASIEYKYKTQDDLKESAYIELIKYYIDDSDIDIDLRPLLSDLEFELIEDDIYRAIKKEAINSANQYLEDNEESESVVSQDDIFYEYTEDSGFFN